MKEKFKQIYGEGQEPRVFVSSGRVNIIGEHIDYNGGNVFPAAIGLGCFIYARENGKNEMNLAFSTTDKTGTIDYNKVDEYKTTPYINYQAGVASVCKKAGIPLTGVDVFYDITVPFGSGLSSSASIEVATAFMFATLADEKNGTNYASDLVNIALLSQKAENEYVGVNCGIMDQFASANGKKDKAILLDCSNLKFEYVDFDLKDYALVIVNTNRPHNLVESKYNERRLECETALELLNKKLPSLKHLCELSTAEFEKVKDVLSGKILDRATHCVYEQARVESARDAMISGDIKKLGEQLYASHESLKTLYEVSCTELDTIVDYAKALGTD